MLIGPCSGDHHPLVALSYLNLAICLSKHWKDHDEYDPDLREGHIAECLKCLHEVSTKLRLTSTLQENSIQTKIQSCISWTRLVFRPQKQVSTKNMTTKSLLDWILLEV